MDTGHAAGGFVRKYSFDGSELIRTAAQPGMLMEDPIHLQTEGFVTGLRKVPETVLL
jgi:hypothetical protein